MVKVIGTIARGTMLLMALAYGHAAAQIVLFEHDDFRGRRVSFDGPVPDLAVPPIGFGDIASSATVRGGPWQVCTEVEFRGRCVTLSPGEYRALASMGMNDRVISVRPVGPAVANPIVPTRRPRVVMFEGRDFAGREIAVDGDVQNFQQLAFNDRAGSVVVESGTWLLCEHEDFRGRCFTLQPGRYPDLGDLYHRLSSARVVESGPPVASPPPQPVPPAPPVVVGGAVLFSQPGLRGRSVALDRPLVRNLQDLGFNDRAASLRIESGYWMFCSDADFEGQCRTFGPGDYVTLPPELDHRISSGRRISERYPYRDAPDWRGR